LHPASAQAQITAKGQGKSLPVMLADLVLEKADSPSQSVELAQKIHVVPEFLGNRAPFADPHARAVIAGLT
ncbi:hypothetical protein CGH97_26430, partial [Vibrio parahaemolyticus]